MRNYIGTIYSEIFWGWLGSFLGIGLVSLLHYQLFEDSGVILLIGSFGASAVLIYGAPASPLAQPRNLVGGHLLSALVGVAVYQALGNYLPLAAALSVSGAIVAMIATGTVHPPGGATALIAVIGGDGVHALGYSYLVVPVLSGAIVMLLVALFVNWIAPDRSYPQRWL